MAIEYITKVSRLQLAPRDKFVLVALADFADKDGRAWPKQSSLAEWTGYNRDTVNRALQALEEDGYIEVEQRRYKDGRYAGKVYRLMLGNSSMRVSPTRPGRHGEADTVETAEHASRADKADTDHADETDTVRADRSDNKTRQHRPANIDPSPTPPTPPSPPAASASPGEGEVLAGLANENSLTTLQRTQPAIWRLFEDLARIQGAHYRAKLAQASALLQAIEDHGADAVAAAMQTIKGSAGDGGPLFGRVMALLTRGARASPRGHMSTADARLEESARSIWRAIGGDLN